MNYVISKTLKLMDSDEQQAKAAALVLIIHISIWLSFWIFQ